MVEKEKLNKLPAQERQLREANKSLEFLKASRESLRVYKSRLESARESLPGISETKATVALLRQQVDRLKAEASNYKQRAHDLVQNVKYFVYITAQDENSVALAQLEQALQAEGFRTVVNTDVTLKESKLLYYDEEGKQPAERVLQLVLDDELYSRLQFVEPALKSNSDRRTHIHLFLTST